MSETRILYLSGPMSGLPDFNRPAFEAARADLVSAGWMVLSPTDAEYGNPTPGVVQSWEWYMRRALRMLTDADALALLPNWQESRGAALEVDVAAALGMPRASVGQWLREEYQR